VSGYFSDLIDIFNNEQIAGPMWSGQLHDPDFIGKVLEHLESSKDQYGTAARMKGMLTVAQEVRNSFISFSLHTHHRQELQTAFYFTPSRVSSHFHCRTPSLDVMASVVLASHILLSLIQIRKGLHFLTVAIKYLVPMLAQVL
jgi:hypothetical protein